jgi:hypothetical protein
MACRDRWPWFWACFNFQTACASVIWECIGLWVAFMWDASSFLRRLLLLSLCVLATPTLLMASAIQSVGWLATTGTGLYCARSGNIQQHREWMMRSYPFAMVFVITRALNAVPAIERMGLIGIETVVWTVIASACLLPSLLIAWQSLATRRCRPKVRIAPSPIDPRT